MKTRAALFLLVLLLPVALTAQPDKFYIGSFYVMGNATDTVRQLNPGPVQEISGTSTYSGMLPTTRFGELEDLGLNMAGIGVDSHFVVRDHNSGGSNVIRDINNELNVDTLTQGLATDIDFCAWDGGLHDATRLKRTILNPESSNDFSHRSSGVEIIHFPDFKHFPYYMLNLDRSVHEQDAVLNCVRFTTSNDTVSGLMFQRKREITAMKDFGGEDPPDKLKADNLVAGLYHVSVILCDDEEIYFNPPNDSTPVLTVRFLSTVKNVFRQV